MGPPPPHIFLKWKAGLSNSVLLLSGADVVGKSYPKKANLENKKGKKIKKKNKKYQIQKIDQNDHIIIYKFTDEFSGYNPLLLSPPPPKKKNKNKNKNKLKLKIK